MSPPSEHPYNSSPESYEQDWSASFDSTATLPVTTSADEANGHEHRTETSSQFWGVPNNVLHDYDDAE